MFHPKSLPLYTCITGVVCNLLALSLKESEGQSLTIARSAQTPLHNTGPDHNLNSVARPPCIQHLSRLLISLCSEPQHLGFCVRMV